jgi:TolB-like protein/DNA-binding winged helix-turn-helix (wHTH) protein/Tfp pilus assembly protein PilF
LSDQVSPDRKTVVFRFGAFEVDFVEKELRKHGSRVKLQGQPFLVLARLLENANRLVSRDELRHELWPEDTFVDFEHSVNEAVNKVRAALGDSAANPRFVETVPRHGYRFIAPVERVGEPAGSAPGPARRPRKTWLFAAAMLVLAAGALLAWVLGLSNRRAAEARIRSLAVLPLENLSGDPAQEYFSDGMTDELTARLARIQELRVISRTSARRYKATDKTLREIGRELGVDALVEGSVRLADGKVRISVSLVEAASDESLWAGTYEGMAAGVLDLQNNAALDIAAELERELAPAPAKGEPPPEAYHAYLKGRHHWNQRTEKDFLKAIEYFSEARTLAPQYAEAWAGLADTYSLLSVYNLQRPVRAMPKAKEAALEALRIDPSLAEVHASYGEIRFLYDWDWAEAEREFRKAIELNPSYASTHQWYGVFLMAMNRPDEGLRTLGRGLELDPLSLSLNENLGWALYVARRYPEAIEQFQRTLELDPGFGQALRYLGLTYLHLGRHQEALETLERAGQSLSGEPDVQADLALAHALAGDRIRAEEMLAALMKESDQRYVSPFLIASFHTGLGDLDDALDWLDRAYQERVANVVFLGVDPAFDPLRAHPRFQALLERIGL